ncbi:MAG: phage tail tube protein [Planctomycetota bacterium]
MAIANAPLSSHRKQLGLRIADAISSDPSAITTPVANTRFDEGLSMRPNGIFEGMEREVLGLAGGTAPRSKGAQKGIASLPWKLRHGDVFYSLLVGAGYVLSGTSSEIARYSRSLSTRQLIDAKVWEDGRYKYMTGCATSSLEISGSAGGYAQCTAELMGIFVDSDDEALPADAATTTPVMTCQSMTVTVGGTAVALPGEFTLNLGLTAAMRPGLTEAFGGLAMYLTEDCKPTLRLNPEARLIADVDGIGDLLAAGTAAIQLVLTDGTNTLTIDAPAAQALEVGDENNGKKLIEPTDYELHPVGADDAVKFTLST